MRIQGTVALITGGSGGLGKAFAEALAKRGGKVLVTDVKVEQGNKVVKQLNEAYGENTAAFYRCDVSVQEDYENAFLHAKKVFGRLDIVANNAGLLTESKWEKMIDINLTSVCRGSLLALKHLRQDKGNNGGVVINVASMAGLIPAFFAPAYAASKHGVVGLTRSLAADIDFPKHQVRFNCLCPSFTKTDMIEQTDFYHNDIAQKVVHSRGIMDPATVAQAFLSLIEDGSLNGAVMRVLLSGPSLFKFPSTMSKIEEFVAEAFIQLIEDNSRNGSVLTVSRDEGMTYANEKLLPPSGFSNGPTSGKLFS